MITAIWSGAQTGADQGGLRAGQALGLDTGGFCPKGCRTETGNQPWLIGRYGLTETQSSGYLIRTRMNVVRTDGTVIYGDLTTPGSQLTYNLAYSNNSPWIINPTRERLLAWIQQHSIHTLNVAGNRESGNPGIGDFVFYRLVTALGDGTVSAVLRHTPRLHPAES